MHFDVQDLRNFYYRSRLGRSAQRAIRDALIKMWPAASLRGNTMVGYGFAVPLLRPYLKQSRRVLALMPAPQGVMGWPVAMPNVSVLVEDVLWPLDTGVVDRLVVIHGVEASETPGLLLEEAYRVLAPGGRAIFIVPNRAGLWARSDATPFGFGRPYSLGQLEAQLKLYGFCVEHHRSALYLPPLERRFWMRTAAFWERIGHHLPLVLAGGVFMVEVTKQIPAPKRPNLVQTVRRPIKALDGLVVPQPNARRGS